MIKQGCPVIFGGARENARQVIEEQAKARKAKLTMVDYNALENVRTDLGGCTFDFKEYRDIRLSLPGLYQPSNGAVAPVSYTHLDVAGSRMIDYSGRGPTSACVCKPDIVAPGSSIISCANRQNGYTVKSGTSMSTPLVSGAIALLLEKYPWMSNKDVKLHLRERAVDLGLPHNQQGWGLLDVERLVR